ncbi:hypothetical protein HK104_003470, partial [Borealophlyctis nickersoniae]
MDTSALCGVQGAWLLLTTVSASTWCMYLIVNLHLHIVWHSSFLERFWVPVHLFCWGIPIAMTVLAAATHNIEYGFGFFCIVSPKVADEYFFYPLSAFIYPAFLLHLITFFSFARVVIKIKFTGGPGRDSSGSSGKSASAARQVLAAFRLQWRAFALASVYVCVFTVYWMAYFLDIRKITAVAVATSNELPQWVLQWVGCIFAGGTQDSCYDISRPFVPRFWLTSLSDTLTCITGIALFLIFGTRYEIIHFWRKRKEASQARSIHSSHSQGHSESYTMHVSRAGSSAGNHKFEINTKFNEPSRPSPGAPSWDDSVSETRRPLFPSSPTLSTAGGGGMMSTHMPPMPKSPTVYNSSGSTLYNASSGGLSSPQEYRAQRQTAYDMHLAPYENEEDAGYGRYDGGNTHTYGGYNARAASRQ